VAQRYMTAIEDADTAAIAAVLREDARLSQQPGAAGNESGEPGLLHGRAAIIAAWEPILHGPHDVSLRLLPVAANRGPAAATYLRWPGSGPFQPFGLAVLTVAGDQVADIAVFGTELFPAFGLPAAL
jgi:RNA polymerase sigma-70 factor (ECF subfamily)